MSDTMGLQPRSGQLALDLPGLTLTETSATVAPDATAAEVNDMLRGLDVRSASLNWWMGDVQLVGLSRVQSGDREMFGYAPLTDQQTAVRCQRVARLFPPATRRPALSWSHHEQVVGLPERHRDRLLDLCVSEGLSVNALRAVMRQEAIDTRGEELPLPAPFTFPAGVLARIGAVVGDDASDVRVVLVRTAGTWKVETP